ncbi:VOC family protein [Calditrichota bacterium]
MSEKPKQGQIIWRDLTVEDAGRVRDFYKEVVGWKSTDHDMGEYNDFNIALPETGEVVAGICHARGDNSTIPPQWLMYVQVDSVEASAQKCVEMGGKVVNGPRKMGESNFCVIQDPAGAVMAIMD